MSEQRNSAPLWPLMKKVLFRFDPELMHESAVHFLKLSSYLIKRGQLINPLAKDPRFCRTFFGCTFRNPVGLAAGFDVNAECLPALQYLGFGYIEVGGITMSPQPGNLHRPRIFRLPKEEALINQLNFYNKGVHTLRKNLMGLKDKGVLQIPIGINLGKSNFSELEQLPSEYRALFKSIKDVADYVTINISCPNTPGLSRFQSKENLDRLLSEVCEENAAQKKKTPILLKLSPDLTIDDATSCAETAIAFQLQGLVLTNTTLDRPIPIKSYGIEKGGLSGRPLKELSTKLLQSLSEQYKGRLVLMGVGGIMDSHDAHEKFLAGADLIQIYTGFVYQGWKFPIKLLESIKEPFFEMTT